MKILMKYYNLQDTFNVLFRAQNLNPPLDIGLYDDLSYRLITYLSNEAMNGLNTDAIKFGEFTDDVFSYFDYVDEMIRDFYNRYYEYNAMALNEYESEITTAMRFFIKFVNAINATYPIYSKLIKLYKDNENKLLNLLERNYTDEGGTTGNSLNRFNDTPQEGGDFKDENHTTNVNQIDSSTTSGLEHKEEYSNDYLINRLNDVNDKLRNLFLEWENKIAQGVWLSPMR